MSDLRDSVRKGAGLCLLMALLNAPALSQAGRGDLYMSGRVLDPSGDPVAGARVKAVLDGRPNVASETKTDGQGKWSVLYVRKGTWLLSAFTSEMTSELTEVLLNVSRRDVSLPLTRTATGILIQAKTAIYEADYDKAVQILSWFIPNFPASREQPGALFWISYAYNQLSRGAKDRDKAVAHMDKALPFLDRLITEFPTSGWKDDAEILRIGLALELVKRGRPEMAEVIERSLVNENRMEVDVKLAALDALLSLDLARAIGLISNVVFGDPDPGIRTKAVMLLGKAAGKEASALLQKAAATDKDPGVRKAAGMWLGR